MQQPNTDSLSFPVDTPQDVLTDILRQGAQQMLAAAIEAEVADWIDRHASMTDAQGHRQVVRNGHKPARTITTGVGPIEVTQPRVHDRRPADQREPFTSQILPPYLRKARQIEQLIPWLYLYGVSTGDMAEALTSLLGPQASGLSATTVTRLKSVWEGEYKDWDHRSLADKHYVYLWADGVHFRVRLEDEGNQKQCILVLMGATAEGKKELIAVSDGYRESKQSWKELLLSVKHRGLDVDPKLASGDGALGFWAAVGEVWPDIKQQRCWVHKTANVLNKLPKSVQAKAKAMLHDIWMAETRDQANKAFDLFLDTFEAKYPKATACLAKDRDVLLTFYDYPAQHWVHIRTTNPIESVFATVRLRHGKTKGSGSRIACLTMVFKLMMIASRSWRALNGSQLIPDVIADVEFIDGVKIQAA